jgi:ATP-dependent helicase YprA (DUF1998 family)
VAVIDEDGSPQAARVFGLWHPSAPSDGGKGRGGGGEGEEEEEEEEEGKGGDYGGGGGGGEEEAVAVKKRSPYKDTARLLAELVQRGLRTLVFVKVCVCWCWCVCVCLCGYVDGTTF